MKIIISALCCIAFLVTTSSSYAESKAIVKWVDKDGVIHYGDRPPMPAETNRSSVLNKDGITVKRIDQSIVNHEVDKVATEQSRRDSALLASYNSIEEIDIARERNTKMDEFSLESLYQKRTNLKEYQQKNSVQIANLRKHKRPVPPVLQQEKDKFVIDIAETDRQINAKKQDIAATTERFEQDKIRYAQLKPKIGALADIKSKKRTIVELEQWRSDAQRRVEYYKNEMIMYKRRGIALPADISDRFLASTEEVARADAEIAEAKTIIKKNEQRFSSDN
jgi:Domain of unknown function (DUF4124)